MDHIKSVYSNYDEMCVYTYACTNVDTHILYLDLLYK